MNRSALSPVILFLPPMLILASMVAARSLPQPWGALKPIAPIEAACAGPGQVSSTRAEMARLELSDALSAQGAALRRGSAYAAAKIGLPPGSPEWARALAAQAAVRDAEAGLAAACAEAR